MVWGLHTSQWPSRSSWGPSADFLVTVKKRMAGYWALAISAWPLSMPALVVHAILDWPEQSHTSPMSTSWMVNLFWPLTWMV